VAVLKAPSQGAGEVVPPGGNRIRPPEREDPLQGRPEAGGLICACALKFVGEHLEKGTAEEVLLTLEGGSQVASADCQDGQVPIEHEVEPRQGLEQAFEIQIGPIF
jgi:hypothetical protein